MITLLNIVLDQSSIAARNHGLLYTFFYTVSWLQDKQYNWNSHQNVLYFMFL